MRAKVRGAAEFIPDSGDLAVLAGAAQRCQGCQLYRNATQAVFGQGAANARLLLIGEQPGDREDAAGAPFVGPAGRLLDQALAEAGIARQDLFLTNAVKHFKFAERGHRRIHKTPSRTEVVACQPWLLSETAAVEPELLVCLGATASKAVLGPAFRLTQHRGQIIGGGNMLGRTPMLCTIHPSAVLRSPDRDQMFAGLAADLAAAAAALG